MRKSLVGIALILSLSALPAYSANTPKAGSPCNKKGVIKTHLGKEFKCITKSAKLVWSKGKLVKKQSTMAAPEATPTVLPSPRPTSTPASSPMVLNFENIIENYREIPKSIFSSFEIFMKNDYQSILEVSTYIGPNSKPNISDPKPAYAIASKILRNYKQPERVHAIYYSFRDKDWAKKTTQEVDGTSRWNYQFDYECLSDDNCRGASAGMNQNWEAIGRFTVKNPNAGALALRMFSSGESEIHEFTHTVYMYQLKPNFNKWYVLTPSWFSEGHATALGKLGGALSYSEYRSDQVLTYNSVRPNETIKSFSKEDVLRFFEVLRNENEEPGMKPYVYSLGYSAVEALIAIGGIDSPMKLFVEASNGGTFEQAFEKVYGVDWNYAAPILAEVVSLQYLPIRR